MDLEIILVVMYAPTWPFYGWHSPVERFPLFGCLDSFFKAGYANRGSCS